MLSHYDFCTHTMRARKPLSLFTEEDNLTRNIYNTVEVVLNSYTPLSNDVNLVIICHYIAMMLTTMGIV